MADERIYITEVKEGDVCPFEQYCEGFSKLCEGCNVLPTRQEAIERMVLAMHNEEIKRSIKDIPCDYRNLAEAALNALLEVEK
jgi:hypothetical protein